MKNWYKILSVILILFTLTWGLLNPVPRMDILNETIRNLYYHVPLWFSMLFLMSVSVVQSIRSLMDSNGASYRLAGMPLNGIAISSDQKAYNAAMAGFFFSIPGVLTGSLWAKFTWGTWWTFDDPKLNGVAVSMLIYLAYFILRSSVDDESRRARISAVYNIFAFVMMNVFIMILPRIHASLHPGNGGNPAFGKYDLNDSMRTVFYPAVIGWILFGMWIYNMRNRITYIDNKLND